MCIMCLAPRPDDDCPYSNPSVTISATIIESGDAPDVIPEVPEVTISVGDEFLGAITSGDRDLVAITLEAGQTYEIVLEGRGTTPDLDTYLRLLDATGNVLVENDDNGSLLSSRLVYVPTVGGTYYLSAGGYGDGQAGSYRLSVTTSAPPAPPEIGTLTELASYLTDGFWEDQGSNRHSFDMSTDNIITCSIAGLTEAGQQLALWAMDVWEMVANINFEIVTSGSADITFDDESAGAYANSSYFFTFTTAAWVNVGTGWLSSYGTGYDSYSFQTYVHELGHALGLGHQGGYNGSASYAVDADFLNDSWSMSVMSYFDQDDNPLDEGSFAYILSSMPADIVAIQTLYGAASGGATAGNTVWGEGNTLGNAMGEFLSDIFEGGRGMDDLSFTIFDEGGIDTIRMTQDGTNQNVSLASLGRSDVMGGLGNMTIARGTIIENFEAGSGNDTIGGNGAANSLVGNGGRDRLSGLAGNDTLDGGIGSDTLWGGANNDSLLGRDGADILYGEAGDDRLFGGNGADRLDGGAGNDQMTGGQGADVFVYALGNDTTFGFQDDVDTLRVEADLLGRGGTWTDFAALADERADRVIFDFGSGNRLVVIGVTDVAVLENDLVLF
ncbi:MAG: M10 family metallopeptidase [Paracoccaceae bacterium]